VLDLILIDKFRILSLG